MKKKILLRALVGVPIGITICFLLGLNASSLIDDGTFYAVVPNLVDAYGSELNAVYVQTLVVILYSAMWGAISVIWECERLNLLKQTLLHFIICTSATFPVAYFLHWMEHSFMGIICYFSIFAFIYCAIWLIQYLSMRRNMKRLNESLRK